MGLWRETPLITNNVARDLVRGGARDAEIFRLWKSRQDTMDIARRMGVRQSEIANRLWKIRERARA